MRLIDDLEISRVGEFIFACPDIMADNPGQRHFLSVADCFAGAPEVGFVKVHSDLGGLATNIGRDDNSYPFTIQ